MGLWVRPLAQELPHATDMAKTKTKTPVSPLASSPTIPFGWAGGALTVAPHLGPLIRAVLPSLSVSIPPSLSPGLSSLSNPLCLWQTQNVMYDPMSELHAQHEELEVRLAALESRLDALGTSLQALPGLIAQAIRPPPPPLPPRPGPGPSDQVTRSSPHRWPPVAPSDCG